MESEEVAKQGDGVEETPEKPSDDNLLSQLLVISRQMAGMRSLQPLLSYVVDEVIALVGAETGYVVLLNEDDSLDFKVRRRADGTDIQSDVDSISRSVLDEVLHKKESVVIRNAFMDPNFSSSMSVMAMQLRSIMCSPLVTQNRVIGAIYVENRSKSGRFSKEDVIPLEFFSNHAAVALENANLNDNLATLVEERTSELVRAKDAAEAATRAKSTFLSTMTHELRTPMNGVLGMTALLRDTPLNNEQKEIVDTIRISGDTLLTLINDILDFSKIEAQRVELEPVSFRLDNCIEQSIALVGPVAVDKQLHVGYTIDKDVPLNLSQDITRLRQVLTNLLSNAVKFTEKGQVEIHVSLVDAAELGQTDSIVSNNAQIKFTVSDTGIGIPSDRIERLFHPFSQAESSTNRYYGGTGLGLVICKRLCELMGGSISVESEEGAGTVFTFYIQAAVNSPTDETSLGEQTSLSGQRILLITKNKLVHRSVQQSVRESQLILETQLDFPSTIKDLDEFSAIIVDTTSSYTDSDSGFLGGQVSTTAEVRSDSAANQLDDISHRHHRAIEQEPAAESPNMAHASTFEWASSLANKGLNRPTVLLAYWGNRTQLPNSEYPLSIASLPIKSSQLLNELVKITGGQANSAISKQDVSSSFDAEMATASPLRILLVEDNIVNQKVALRMLERFGYSADVANNGQDAVVAVERAVYDIIFMDVQMPKMDGIEATQIIRKIVPKEEQPYIVAMTANTMLDARESYQELGMDEYISKPVSVNALQAALRHKKA